MSDFRTNLNNQRARFVEVFNDTLNVCKKYANYLEMIDQSIAQTKFYDCDTFLNVEFVPTIEQLHNVVVTSHRTFEAAKLLKMAHPESKVVVLNFASASNPGGGVLKGSSAQEECLCRASTLYPCLNTDLNYNRYYKANREKNNPLHDDKIIYIPNIIVFKTDDKSYTLLKEDERYSVDVITCAAPNLREKPSNAFNSDGNVSAKDIDDITLYTLHYNRAKAIIMAAAENKVDYLVLGAFGCGAFKNNPRIVARAYKDILVQSSQYFKGIEFAVYCNSYEDENYKAFKEILVNE